MKKVILILSVFSLSYLTLFSQDKEEKKSYLNASVNYTTNSVYEGRSDSIVTPYIGTSIDYHFRSGIFVNGALNFYPNRQDNILDLGTLGVGYEFQLIKDKLSGSISYTKNFYSKYSTQVNSETKGAVAADLSFDFTLFQLSLDGDYDYGEKTDGTLSSSISKGIETFKIAGNALSITPTVTVFAGTQNLYATYLKKRPTKVKANKGKKDNSVSSSIIDTYEAAYSKFEFKDFDVSLPVSYTYKIFTFSITPTLAFPVNVVQSGEFTNRPFYVNFSASIKI